MRHRFIYRKNKATSEQILHKIKVTYINFIKHFQVQENISENKLNYYLYHTGYTNGIIYD